MGPGRGGLGFTGENAGKRGRELMKEAAGPHAENTACFSLKLRPQFAHTFIRVGKVAEDPERLADVPNQPISH